jgi:hypothetical protein
MLSLASKEMRQRDRIIVISDRLYVGSVLSQSSRTELRLDFNPEAGRNWPWIAGSLIVVSAKAGLEKPSTG